MHARLGSVRPLGLGAGGRRPDCAAVSDRCRPRLAARHAQPLAVGPIGVQEIVRFGKWIFPSSILGFLVNNGDRLLLGAMVDTTVLGVYVIAFFIVNAVEQALLRIVGNVTYPALSQVVRDRPWN